MQPCNIMLAHACYYMVSKLDSETHFLCEILHMMNECKQHVADPNFFLWLRPPHNLHFASSTYASFLHVKYISQTRNCFWFSHNTIVHITHEKSMCISEYQYSANESRQSIPSDINHVTHCKKKHDKCVQSAPELYQQFAN